jgi:hypothetical protein
MLPITEKILQMRSGGRAQLFDQVRAHMFGPDELRTTTSGKKIPKTDTPGRIAFRQHMQKFIAAFEAAAGGKPIAELPTFVRADGTIAEAAIAKPYRPPLTAAAVNSASKVIARMFPTPAAVTAKPSQAPIVVTHKTTCMDLLGAFHAIEDPLQRARFYAKHEASIKAAKVYERNPDAIVHDARRKP